MPTLLPLHINPQIQKLPSQTLQNPKRLPPPLLHLRWPELHVDAALIIPVLEREQNEQENVYDAAHSAYR